MVSALSSMQQERRLNKLLTVLTSRLLMVDRLESIGIPVSSRADNLEEEKLAGKSEMNSIPQNSLTRTDQLTDNSCSK